MKILYAASEAVPFAKTGGLADVAGALPKALAKLDNEVKLILPRYRQVGINQFSLRQGPSAQIKLGGEDYTATVYSGEMPGTTVESLLIDIPEFFDRDELYQEDGVEYEDNFERYAAFCMAVLELVPQLGFKPDIVHLNDWHTALVAPLLRLKGRYPGFEDAATILTIHNLAYQGLYPKEKASLLGISGQELETLGLEYYDEINLLKSGIVSSDFITTVSPKYAEEIQTMEYGRGLESVLRSRASHLFGVINGIDTDKWNPSTDPDLIHNYNKDDLRPKLLCKSFLQDEMGITVDKNAPLIGVVGRLADQKGFDLVAEVMRDLLDEGIQLVVLGTGDPKYHRLLEELKSLYPGNMGLVLGFSEELAHRIYAGSDMFLMPSRFEPCGLGQMISLAYATIPIVRATGGLADTIVDADNAPASGYGFVFHDYNAGALHKTIKRACAAFGDKNRWHILMQRAIELDYGWESSAHKYLELYERALMTK